VTEVRESEGVGRRVPGLGGEAAAHAGCLRCPCIGSVTREMMYSPHSLKPVTAHPLHTSSLQALKAPGTRCKYRCTSSTRIVRMGFRHAVQVPVHIFNTHCSYGLQARGASTGAHLQHALFVWASGTRCKYRCTTSTRIVRMDFRHAVQVPVHTFNTHCSYAASLVCSSPLPRRRCTVQSPPW
jgi:hypothetical protein